VIICHRTGSESNPYVVINVSIEAWLHGHSTHPALDGRSDILLKQDAEPGEKLPVSACGDPGHVTTTTTTTTTTATIPKEPTVPVVSTPATPGAAPTVGPDVPGPAEGVKGAHGASAELGKSVVTSKLPFTGVSLWIAVLAGIALLGSGLALRRAFRPGS
jgi:hypothetical protein